MVFFSQNKFAMRTLFIQVNIVFQKKIYLRFGHFKPGMKELSKLAE